MHKVLLIFIITYFFSLPALTLTKKDFTDKQLLCPKLLWGVEFISSNNKENINKAFCLRDMSSMKTLYIKLKEKKLVDNLDIVNIQELYRAK